MPTHKIKITDVSFDPDNLSLEIGELHFGHEADPPINVRKEGREEDVIPLASSIAAIGLEQPLKVRSIGGKWYVRDGNRRLAALRYLVEHADLDPSTVVGCTISSPGVNDTEGGLAANTQRVDLDDLDKYEAFAELHVGGMTKAAIGRRFGMSSKAVARVLALGQLSPKIRAAWRAGKITEETARAFTLGRDHSDQDRVFNKLSKSKELWKWQVVSEFGGNDHAAREALGFVGHAAYRAAGGSLTADLFSDVVIIHDPDIAKRLLQELLEEKRRELLAAGWAWVDVAPKNHNWLTWDRLDHADREGAQDLAAQHKEVSERMEGAFEDHDEWNDARSRLIELETELAKLPWPEEARSRAGCIVTTGYDGELSIAEGLIRPGDEPERPTADEPKSTVPTISSALQADLCRIMTAATATAIDARTATAAIVTAILTDSSTYESPVRLVPDGLARTTVRVVEAGDTTMRFDRLFERLLSDDKALADSIVLAAGQALNMLIHNGPPLAERNTKALVDAIDEKRMWSSLLEAFDRENYFKRAPKSFAELALREINGPDVILPKKKADLVKSAIAETTRVGWLPPELRTKGYDRYFSESREAQQ